MTVPRASKTKPRRRREAAESREEILDAAEKQLVETGPAGIRLQEVAADAGVSHPTVLHHFGSREGLVKAVIERAMEALHADLVARLRGSTGEEDQLAAMLEATAQTLEERGYARVILWLALEGHALDVPGVHLGHVTDAAHALRKSKGRNVPREDTAYTVALATMALLAVPVMGKHVLENAGANTDPVRFRRWIARLLVRHLDGS